MPELLSAEEESRLIEAIRQAERYTSGEVRVHMQKVLATDVLHAAQECFHELGMDQTELRNGVLFFVAPDYRKFAVIGDKGVNEVVPSNFWDEVVGLLRLYFSEGRFADGLCEGVILAGKQLARHFPLSDKDRNELPDDISKA